MALSLCMSLGAAGLSSVGAAERVSEESDLQLVSTVTNPEELEKIIEQDNIQVPEGYHLEKVETFVYDGVEPQMEQPIIEPRAILYEIRNVRHSPNQFIYTNEYESDWFYGPCTATETYSQTQEARVDIDTSIGDSTVEAAIGFSISQSYTHTRNYTVTVPAGKAVNVRIHMNYTSTMFDIYNKWTGNLKEKDAWAAKPIGLVFKQYTYNA